MKAKIYVTPKKAVLDPQGKAVANALHSLGFGIVKEVRIGKYMEVELSGGDKDAVRKQLDEMCLRILSNPVIEDYRFELEA
jgi:phosphoribosylformylglycinamidine synthase